MTMIGKLKSLAAKYGNILGIDLSALVAEVELLQKSYDRLVFSHSVYEAKISSLQSEQSTSGGLPATSLRTAPAGAVGREPKQK